jgi:hypothetical protein
MYAIHTRRIANFPLRLAGSQSPVVDILISPRFKLDLPKSGTDGPYGCFRVRLAAARVALDKVVRGTLQKLGNRYVVTATILDIKSLEMGGADMRIESIDDAYDNMGPFVAQMAQTPWRVAAQRGPRCPGKRLRRRSLTPNGGPMRRRLGERELESGWGSGTRI